MKPATVDLHYRTLCLRIVPLTGAAIRLTMHPRDLAMSNGALYLSVAGYEYTGFSASAVLSPSMIDIQGIAGLAGIGADQIASGLFDNARCYLFAVDWRVPVEDAEPVTASILGKTTLLDDVYKIEEMGLTDALNQSVGKTYTAACQKKFGGQEYAGCKIALSPVTVTGTITAVTSACMFRDAVRTEAADRFAAGTVCFTSGANAALKPLEIKSYASDGTIETYESFYYPVAAGDAYTMIPGCRKRRAEDCRDKWSNVVNFGGFADMPTSSQYTQAGS